MNVFYFRISLFSGLVLLVLVCCARFLMREYARIYVQHNFFNYIEESRIKINDDNNLYAIKFQGSSATTTDYFVRVYTLIKVTIRKYHPIYFANFRPHLILVYTRCATMYTYLNVIYYSIYCIILTYLLTIIMIQNTIHTPLFNLRSLQMRISISTYTI